MTAKQEPDSLNSRDKEACQLVALASHPIQYQAPLFRELSSRDEIDLTVYFCDRQGIEAKTDSGFETEIAWDVPLLEGYDHVFLDNISPLEDTNSFFGLLNPGLVMKLREDQPDVLWIHGYMAATNTLAFAMAPFCDLGVIFRGESTLLDPPPWYVRSIKRQILRTLFETVDVFAAIGSRNREFYTSFDIADERIIDVPYTVDNDFWQSEAAKLPESDDLRDRHDISSDQTVFLFVGKLIERKRPDLLLQAFCTATANDDAILMFVGDGELRDQLERETRHRGRDEDVIFAGFQNQSELPEYYELSDVFVLPSRQENWGLVINEAMNFGLPIIATGEVGATEDLVDGENGFVIDTADVATLATAIKDCLERPGMVEEMGQVSKERIEDWGIEQTADGMIRCVQAVVNGV
ncbi:glycosyltransferase family 4 protein [Halopenitus persicus]|uniref:Glycosyltransferase involved in cell wall bisynthesis n=1 Tax=Halopenitus persicus TaxID=1048396 RepID=A0A1H3IYE9_9EURY|nr:glycosyltransferase family 4 protein [Halopenitus persicus]SDY32783.1 Glycosyltransferase involved in cell wall bisynthesis [Halopenitus persicus]